MKIAIAGKGGVGKTTLASMLARTFSAEGRAVLAVDADPDANLAAAIGLPADRLADVKPIAAMRELAAERTGHGGGFGGFFKLNPTVDDLPEALSATHAGVRILALGAIKHGGSGCVCPEHTLLRALMRHILLRQDEVVIMDMEAGVEHLGRATADSVDVLIIVVEPGRRSLETAAQIERLAADIGVGRVAYVGCKLREPSDQAFLESVLPKDRFLGSLTFNNDIRAADLDGRAPYERAPEAAPEIAAIKDGLMALLAARTPA